MFRFAPHPSLEERSFFNLVGLKKRSLGCKATAKNRTIGNELHYSASDRVPFIIK